MKQTPEEAVAVRAASRGIQSIEVGGRLLQALVHLGRPLALKELAQAAHMPAAKAHPYLVSFGKLGLVEQDAATGRYGLGGLALQMGLIGLQQADPVRLASAELPALAREIGQTVGIAIWGNRGPTFVRLEEGPTAVHVNMRHGTVVSVRHTASGRLFAAFMSADALHVALQDEPAPGAAKRGRTGTRAGEAAFEAELAEIRAQRFSSLVDGTVQGVAACSAPVFDGFGAMVLALTAIGPRAALDPSPEGAAAQALRRCARALSERLGARPAAG